MTIKGVDIHKWWYDLCVDLVDKYLKAIGTGVTGEEGKTLWPLKPSQISPYYDVDQAIEVYEILKKLKNSKNDDEIARLFKYPSVIRNFIRNAGIIGLKVANSIGIKNYSVNEKVDYLEYLLKLVGLLVKSDPLCLDGKNLLLGPEELNALIKSDVPWQNAIPDRPFWNGLYTTLFSWIWSTHYNIFTSAGLELHGPYDVSKQFGKKSIMLIRDFHGAHCPDVWTTAKSLPFKSLIFYQIYKNVELSINFEGQILGGAALGSYLSNCLIEIDGNFISNRDELEDFDEEVANLTSKQTKVVNELNKFDQIRKGVQISYFPLKKLYEAAEKNWWKPQKVDMNIKTFGDKFLNSLDDNNTFTREYFNIVNDPRNNLIGKDALESIEKTHVRSI